MRQVLAGAVLMLSAGVLCLLQAQAQIVPLMGAGGKFKVSSTAESFSLVYKDNRSVDVSTSTQSVTYNSGGDPDCGAANANRYVVVGAYRRTTSGAAPSSVTIGGVTATQAAYINNNAVIDVGIWYANVTSGTTCAVTIVWNASAYFDSSIVVYRLITTTATPSTTQTVGNPDSSVTLSYTVPSSGASLNVVSSRAAPATTWTNATEDIDISNAGRAFSGATVSSSGSVSVTAASTNSDWIQEVTGAASAWSP